MINEITKLIASLPSVSRLGGVVVDYMSGDEAKFCIKSEPGYVVKKEYLDGKSLVRRAFTAEVAFSFSGTTETLLSNHQLLENMQDEINNAPYPQIKEGEIVKVGISGGGYDIKNSIGKGVLTFKFYVDYKTALRRGINACYNI